MTATTPSALDFHVASTRQRDPLFIIAVSWLGLVVLVAIIGPWISPFDPNAIDLRAINAPPGTAGHVLGTDQLGRDVFSRLLTGARLSLIGPLIVIAGSTLLGVVIGGIAGWMGGWVDVILSRVIDFLFAFPGLLLAIFAVALFGPGIVTPAIALAIAFTPVGARLMRNLVMRERGKDYVSSLRVLGFSSVSTFSRHVFPNVSAPMLSQTILGFSYAVVDLAAISYLGLGVQPPAFDWGLMISEGQQSLLAGAPWPVLWPALVIVLVVVAFNHVGERIVDIYNRRY
jgi:peptide/nickel transport system permease protein